MKVPENDELFDEIVNEWLEKLGYIRYEISNYALKQESKSFHNITYWNNSIFAGVGIDATGFEQKEGKYYLTKNEGNILSYKKQFQLLTKNDYYFKIIMMGLRLVEGIDLTLETNQKVYKFYEQIIKEKINSNLLEISNNKLKCTERGFNILNEILIDFL
ncbi:hypothetical protein [Spiroplasma endosymbiont of Atherix ibis]|uniref:hypothetical protein n=1 Tax=Spiroplasma endosymbiont of Atherix ibis TaxID=3066291 RepID=UPI0030D26035